MIEHHITPVSMARAGRLTSPRFGAINRWIAVTAMIVALLASPCARGQSVEPDAKALEAFTELIASYRARPALGIKTTVKIEVMDGDVVSHGSEVTAEFLFGQNRTGVVKLRDFTCYLTRDANGDDGEAPAADGVEPNASGTVTAVHSANENEYFTIPDDGSPYYLLLTSFQDMPFPELAIFLGEEAIDDVRMQFHPKDAWLQPTAVEAIEKDGALLQKLTMSSDNAQLDMLIDPATKLIESMELQITGGDLVQQGMTLVYRYTYEYDVRDKSLAPEELAFDPGQRQKVDMIMALAPQPKRDAEGNPEGGALANMPAPPIVLATLDGKAVDLGQLKGRVVVLDFWATWCPPCIQALPQLHEFAEWASQEQLPVTVLTVNVFEIRDPETDNPDARVASARKTWEKHGFTLPVAMDFTDEVAAAYQVNGIPATFVIRADGIVHVQHTGAPADYVEALKADVRAAMEAVEPGM